MTMTCLAQIEVQRQREQAKLDALMGLKERNRTGQFATPPALADEIVQYARRLWNDREGPIRFLEPCVGTGSFYSSLRRHFDPAQIQSASGFELDPHHAAVAQQLWREAGLCVKQADFTTEPLAGKCNLLITNPPYVRHHHLSRPQKELLQAKVAQQLRIRPSGLSGLYCYFLMLAHAWLEEGALSIWLIPSEFMDVNYGTAVREYLTTRVRLLHIHRFAPTDVKFDDALVSSAVVVFENSPPAQQAVTFAVGGTLMLPGKASPVAPTTLATGVKWSNLANSSAIQVQNGTPAPRFGDVFTIKRGLATGNNNFFILRRAEAQRLGLPDECLKPILPSPRQLREPVIEAESDGYPRLDPQMVLLDCRLAEPCVQERHPQLRDYLQIGQSQGVHEGYLTQRRVPWYSQEDRPPPPYLCTYMGRQGNGRKPFRFLWNKSQATAHNVYLLLYPRGVLKEALARDPSLHEQVFRALQSLDTDQITGGGRVYGGGLFKMEPNELANLRADWMIPLGLEQDEPPARQASLLSQFANPHN